MNFHQQTLTVAIALATLAAGQAPSRAASRDVALSDPTVRGSRTRAATPLPGAFALAASSLQQRDPQSR